ncbi:DUF1648 domain-containing protein [Cohnella soli]|uniref:DUF1648 domain-containing protein n=1 Tax=Cohnella soli TaxID=425005 RepID=A0ABW0HQ20_9BACL
MMQSWQSPRPKIEIARSALEKALQLAGWLVLIAMIVFISVKWGGLPQRMPTHFNLRGEPDGWGSRWTLWILPAISALLFIGLNQLSRVPHVFNYPVAITEQNAAFQYTVARQLLAWINFEITVMFAYISWTIVNAAKSGGVGGAWDILIIVGVLFVTIGIYLTRAIRGR